MSLFFWGLNMIKLVVFDNKYKVVNLCSSDNGDEKLFKNIGCSIFFFKDFLIKRKFVV